MAESTEVRVDFATPQLTLRAALTGMTIGGVLCICNVYTGLKIGWGLNMSITGILLAYAFWYALHQASGRRVRMFGKLENNVNQSAVSAAGAVSSAGLVSAIPALTMIDGTTLPWWQLSLWIATVCLVGIAVATGLRRQMIIRDNLAFPGGVACATTLKEVYTTGRDAMVRVGVLAGAAVTAGAIKVFEIIGWVKRTTLGLTIGGQPASMYSFGLDPTLLMVAVGGLIGFRASWSVMLGSVLAWVVIGPQLVARDMTPAARGPVGEWLLWPGVTLMVVASLVSLAFSAPAILRAFRRTGGEATSKEDTGEVSRTWFFRSCGVALVLAVILQVWLFDIAWWAAVAAVLLSFALAVVASRVSGETNVTPVGAMGKVTQLVFAVLMPKNAAANLMSASVTAGAASQCADLMHDLKCGYMLGAVARKQVIAQFLGSVVGAAIASGFYLILVPDPATMLLTDKWPAPAVAQWRGVALVFREGLDSLPPGATTAMLIAGIAGIVLPVLEKVLPGKAKAFVPSAAAVGLAFVIPMNNAISMFIGGCIGLACLKAAPLWTGRYFVTICAGVIAGESLVGAGDAVRVVASGLSAEE